MAALHIAGTDTAASLLILSALPGHPKSMFKKCNSIGGTDLSYLIKLPENVKLVDKNSLLTIAMGIKCTAS